MKNLIVFSIKYKRMGEAYAEGCACALFNIYMQLWHGLLGCVYFTQPPKSTVTKFYNKTKQDRGTNLSPSHLLPLKRTIQKHSE